MDSLLVCSFLQHTSVGGDDVVVDAAANAPLLLSKLRWH